MNMQSKQDLVCDTSIQGVRVVRFVRPDLNSELYDQGNITDCSLFQELNAAALATLPAGDIVVINFGLIDGFVSAFYRLLLAVQEAVRARNGRLLLCCLTANVRECFDIMAGGKVFQVRATESNAVSEARKAAS